MGLFFATTGVTHLSPKQFFGLAFWAGFSINTLIIELWLRSQKGKSQIEKIAMRPLLLKGAGVGSTVEKSRLRSKPPVLGQNV
jgi:hypothetical protein